MASKVSGMSKSSKIRTMSLLVFVARYVSLSLPLPLCLYVFGYLSEIRFVSSVSICVGACATILQGQC